MDFAFSEDQEALRGLVKRILRDRVTPEALHAVEKGEGWDRGLWAELAKSELLGLSLPTAMGGSGLGFVETCLVLEQAGRRVAPIPVWSTLVLGGDTLTRLAPPEIQQAWLPGVATGETVLTGAIAGQGAYQATESADGWHLTGRQGCVPMAGFASGMVVGTDAGVFIVDLNADGVTIAPQEGTNGMPLGEVTLDAVSATWLAGAEAWAGVVSRAETGLAAVLLGVANEALILTARYTTERQQFDRPIATFQAVTQRVADAYVDVETMRVALWRAAWLLDRGDPAINEALVAKLYALDGAHRVVNAAQHLHGGMGFVRDYPLHRYFLMAKQLEFLTGGAAATVARLGARLAAEG